MPTAGRSSAAPAPDVSGSARPGVRPEHDAAFWADLAAREWRRVRWRVGVAGVPGWPSGDARCVAFDLPLHRAGTYYRRPAYTDGAVWLSQPGHDEMTRRAGRAPSRRTRGA